MQGEVAESEVVRLAVAAVKAGADEVMIADTVGFADPLCVQRLFTAALSAVGDIPVSAQLSGQAYRLSPSVTPLL